MENREQAIETIELGQRRVPMNDYIRPSVAHEATSGAGGDHVPAQVNLVGLGHRVVEEENVVLGHVERRYAQPCSLAQKPVHPYHDRRVRDGYFPDHPGKSAPPRPA